MSGRDQLGFQGLLDAGMTPAEAWAEVRKTSAHPAVQAIIRDMGSTAEGREALDWSRARWAEFGLTPPWDLEAQA